MKKAPTMMKIKRQRGNILFVILIAVALLGALSAVLTQGGRSGRGADSEVNSVTISQVLQYASNLKSGYDRMILAGIPRATITFITDTTDPDYELDTNLFSPVGPGGVPVQEIPLNIFSDATITDFDVQWSFHAGINGTEIQLPGIGTAAGADEVAVLGPLTQAVCTQINRSLYRSNPPDTNPDLIPVTGLAEALFIDETAGGVADLSTATDVADLTNRGYMCIRTSQNTFYYIHLMSEF